MGHPTGQLTPALICVVSDLKQVVNSAVWVLQLHSEKETLTQVVVLTPAQLRAARAILGWSREDLAVKSGGGAETVKNFELRGSDPKLGTVQKWKRALEAAGVAFLDETETDGPGVRLKKARAKR
jgi:ribosome-binding protein aMBF1 (putative translation factor)